MKTFFSVGLINSWVFSGFIACSYLLYNIWLINGGHFHEDAYIMFIYVENLLNGYGISYYPEAPRSEGATDFLWLILLTILGILGLDTGTSAIVLNAIGVLVISCLLILLLKKEVSKKHYYILLPFTVLWMFQPFLLAALGGFSVFFYLAMVLLTFVAAQDKKWITYTPILSIILGLVRPDGVLLGIAFTLIGFFQVYSTADFKRYMFNTFLAAFIGIGYFLWRYSYFGNLLPLPLYVKSAGEGLAGLDFNIRWLKSNLFLVLATCYLLYINKQARKFFVLAVPTGLLLMALATATQSQNIGYRFQAPLYIMIYFIMLSQLCIALRQNKKGINRISVSFCVFLLCFLSVKQVIRSKNEVRKSNYINQFPFDLNKELDSGLTIVLTEAGRMAYWNQENNKIIDLVGLNTEYPAKNIATESYIDSLSADVFMYHHAELIDTKGFQEVKQKRKFFKLNDDNVSGFTNKISLTKKQRSKNKVKNASYTMTEYLKNNFNNYDIFLVDYRENKTYSHVYAFRKGLLSIDTIRALFSSAFEEKSQQLSYYQMQRINDDASKKTNANKS